MRLFPMIIVSLVLSSEDHFPWPDLRLRHNPLGHDAGLRGLCDARRRHDPTGPLRHRHFRLLAVSKITPCSNLRRIGFHVLRVHQRQGHDLREHVRRARRATQKEARVVTRRAHVHIFCPYRSHALPAAGSFF